jgi:probable rRNA maturation factor
MCCRFPPMGADAYLGDVAVAYGVTSREAKDAGKPFAAHATHLVVHGVLHLLGYDHERAREARVMEPLEIAILAELGIANPYVARAA